MIKPHHTHYLYFFIISHNKHSSQPMPSNNHGHECPYVIWSKLISHMSSPTNPNPHVIHLSSYFTSHIIHPIAKKYRLSQQLVPHVTSLQHKHHLLSPSQLIISHLISFYISSHVHAYYTDSMSIQIVSPHMPHSYMSSHLSSSHVFHINFYILSILRNVYNLLIHVIWHEFANYSHSPSSLIWYNISSHIISDATNFSNWYQKPVRQCTSQPI